MSEKILIIDIARDQVAWVLISHGVKGINIDGQASSSRMTNSQEPAFSSLEKMISQIFAKPENRFDKCLVSIPARHFFFRTLDLPFKNRKKISQVLAYELEKHLPLDAGGFEFDFSLISRHLPPKKGLIRIATASLDHDTIQAVESFMGDFKAVPDGLTPGSGYSSALFFAKAKAPSQLCFFLYLEKAAASVYAIQDREVLFSRTFYRNENNLGTGLTHTFNLINERLDMEEPLSMIAISGNARIDEKFCTRLAEKTGVPILEFDIFDHLKDKNISFSGSPSGQEQNAIATGINEINRAGGYNFSQRVSDLSLFFLEHKTRLAVSLALFFILALILSIPPVLRIKKMETRIENLDTAIVRVFKSSFPDIKTIIDPVGQMQVKLAGVQKTGNTAYMDGHLLNIDLLNEINRALPASLDIMLTRFVRTRNNLLIAGTADQFNTIDKMKSDVEQIVLFKGVDINSASMDKQDNRVKFSLKITF